MANVIKKGESIFIPFENGASIYDSQLKPRMYKTKEQYEKYRYRCGNAELVEYAEVVRCKDCKSLEITGCYGECKRGYMGIVKPWDFCSYGEKKDE